MPKGSSNAKIDVKFGLSFATLPGVVATPLYVGSTTAVQVAVSEANYTGCKLVCTNNSATTDYYVSYIAFERMDA